MSAETQDNFWRPNPSFKVTPPAGYPPEEGRYLRGNDYSPVAVCVILKWPEDKIPPDIEQLVRVGVESGAALSGTLQTENIGIEKMLCNLAANPNIRWLVICGPESPGHLTGQALQALWENGVGEDFRINGAEAPTPYLYNIPRTIIERVRQQIRLVNLLNEGRAALVREAVWACYQETPTVFRDYELFDPGAYPEPPLCETIMWRVQHPWAAPRSAAEQAALERMQALMELIRQKQQQKRAEKPADKD